MHLYQVKLYLTSSLLFAFFWLMLSGISQKLKADDTLRAKVASYQVVDACGNKKEQVIIAIDLGKIVKSDSLFGCNFQLSYDSTKIKMHSALYINTLAEFFDIKQVGFFRNGKIYGVVAVNFTSPQVTGEKPLIAFLGDYLKYCKDSVEVKIDYLEFTDEFKRPLAYQSGYVVAEPNLKSDLHIKVYPQVDTSKVLIDSSETSVKLICEHKPDTMVSRIGIKVKLENSDKFYFKGLDIVNPIILTKISEEIKENEINSIYSCNSKINDKTLFNLRVGSKKKDTSKAIFTVDITEIDECACATKFVTSTGYLATDVKKDTTGISDQVLSQIQNVYYNYISDEFIINSDKEIRKVEIYDLLSYKLFDKCFLGEKFIPISANNMNAGCYFTVIEFLDGSKEKKILIKFNY